MAEGEGRTGQIAEEYGERKFGKRAIEVAALTGIFGFAGGWAITKALVDFFHPDDPNNTLYGAMGGILMGAGIGALSASGVIQIVPQRTKYGSKPKTKSAPALPTK